MIKQFKTSAYNEISNLMLIERWDDSDEITLGVIKADDYIVGDVVDKTDEEIKADYSQMISSMTLEQIDAMNAMVGNAFKVISGNFKLKVKWLS